MKARPETISPLKRFNKLFIAIPASFVSDMPHLREKTFRIGLIGRAAAMFRVDEVIIYPDMSNVDQKRDIKLIQTILSYMETPQYLRKRLFKIIPELQYAGTLPPLRTPHHPTANKTENLAQNEYREGVVLSHSKEGSLIDIGVEQPIMVLGAKLEANMRVIVKITELDDRHLKAVLANLKEVKTYWGYRISVSNVPFVQFLKKSQLGLVIATSRRGKPITTVWDELKKRWKSSQNTLVAFGAPTQGLYEIAAHEHFKLDDVAHFVVNSIPNQATETVRTEEAIYATLSILNSLNNE